MAEKATDIDWPVSSGRAAHHISSARACLEISCVERRKLQASAAAAPAWHRNMARNMAYIENSIARFSLAAAIGASSSSFAFTPPRARGSIPARPISASVSYHAYRVSVIGANRKRIINKPNSVLKRKRRL